MDDIRCFLAGNAVKYTAAEVEISDRFCDEEGNPIPWKIKILTAKEMEGIKKACTVKVVNAATQKTELRTDEENMGRLLLEQCVLFPNLKSEELQNSYGVMDAAELAEAMLTPGEYAKLSKAIMEAQGVDMGLAKDIKKIKN